MSSTGCRPPGDTSEARLGRDPPHAPRPSETLWSQESGHPAPCVLTLPPGSPSLCPISSLPAAQSRFLPAASSGAAVKELRAPSQAGGGQLLRR